MVSTALLVIAGFAVPDGWASYRALVDESGSSFVEDVVTSGFSVLEMWLALIPQSWIAVALWLISGGLVVAAFWLLLGRLGDRLEPSFAMAVILGLLVAPRTGAYDWMLLIVPAVLVWQTYPAFRSQTILAGAWLFPAGALSRLLANATEASFGSFVQVAPIVLAATAWWWFTTATRESAPTSAG